MFNVTLFKFRVGIATDKNVVEEYLIRLSKIFLVFFTATSNDFPLSYRQLPGMDKLIDVSYLIYDKIYVK